MSPISIIMFLQAGYLAGASPFVMHLAGVSAIIGHVFPFYLHFRGGQGVATATAIMIYYLMALLSASTMYAIQLF